MIRKFHNHISQTEQLQSMNETLEQRHTHMNTIYVNQPVFTHQQQGGHKIEQIQRCMSQSKDQMQSSHTLYGCQQTLNQQQNNCVRINSS